MIITLTEDKFGDFRYSNGRTRLFCCGDVRNYFKPEGGKITFSITKNPYKGSIKIERASRYSGEVIIINGKEVFVDGATFNYLFRMFGKTFYVRQAMDAPKKTFVIQWNDKLLSYSCKIDGLDFEFCSAIKDYVTPGKKYGIYTKSVDGGVPVDFGYRPFVSIGGLYIQLLHRTWSNLKKALPAKKFWIKQIK